MQLNCFLESNFYEAKKQVAVIYVPVLRVVTVLSLLRIFAIVESFFFPYFVATKFLGKKRAVYLSILLLAQILLCLMGN
jgi:hypothetical protein